GLLRILGPFERVFVLLAGLRVAPQARVGVAQMLGDRGIVASQVDRLLELLDRLLVIALAVIHPAQAVDVEAVLGLDFERASDELLGLVEAFAGVGVSVAEVVERLGVIGVERNRLAHLGDAQLLLLGLVVERAEREVVFVVVG